MTDAFAPALAALRQKLAEQERTVGDTKRMINQLSEMAGLPKPFSEADLSGGDSVPMSLRPDIFYGQPLATCVKQFLQMRRAQNQGAATVNEIFLALTAGGYKFETKNDENSKRSLRISFAKNPAFHRLPNGTYGLTEWYPKAQTKQAAEAADEDEEPEVSGENAED